MMQTFQTTKVLAALSLLLAIVIWAAVPSVAKVALAYVTPAQYMVLRYLLAGLIFIPFFGKVLAGMKRLPKRDWGWLIGSSCLLIYAQVWTLQQVSASWYIVVFSCCPVLIALLLRYRFNLKSIAGLVVTVAGLALYLHDSHQHQSPFSFIAMCGVVASMLAWVAYSVVITRFHQVYDDMQLTAVCSYISILFALVLYISDGNWAPPADLSWSVTAVIVLSGALMPLGLLCYSYAMRQAQTLTIFGQYLEPPIGLLIAFIVFGTGMTLTATVSVACIIAGTIALTHFSVKPPSQNGDLA